LRGFLLSGQRPAPKRTRRSQRGYLREIPLLLLVVALVLAVLLPRLSPGARKLALAAAALPAVAALYYMIVVPGWLPETRAGRRRGWRLAMFLGCTAAIVAAVAAFILR
jgi:hypothetical protein